jgi:hypothetical protein
MSRRCFDEQLADLSPGIRRTFERFDTYALSQPGVVARDLFEGRSYKLAGRMIARVDPKSNSGDGYLGVRFALAPEYLRGTIGGRVASFVKGRPDRPSGGPPWVFAQGEDPLLDAWLADTFDAAHRAVRQESSSS